MAKKKAKPVTLKFAVGEKVYVVYWVAVREYAACGPYEIERILINSEGIRYRVDASDVRAKDLFRTKREANAAAKKETAEAQGDLI